VRFFFSLSLSTGLSPPLPSPHPYHMRIFLLSRYVLPQGASPREGAAFPLCASTGNFCSKAAQVICTPFHGKQARESAFAELGANVSAYFKLGKLLAILYFLILLLCIPLISINFYGGNDGSISANPLASTTMGNVAGVNGTHFLVLPGLGVVDLLPTSFAYGMLDTFAVLLAVCAFVWGKVYVSKESKQVNKLSLSVRSYSVYLPNVPPQTTERDLLQWVEGVVQKEEGDGALDVYGIVCAANKLYAEREPGLFAPIEPTASKTQTLQRAFKVEMVTLVPSHGLVEDFVPRLGPQEEACAAQEGKIVATALLREALCKKPSLMNRLGLWALPTKESLVKDLALLREKASKNSADLNVLLAERLGGGRSIDQHFPTTGAFLSFER
jgi:hypothetical protein